LCPNWENIGVFTIKLNHPLEITFRKSLLLRQFVFEVDGEARDYAGAPAFLFLAGGNEAANVPIHDEHFGVRGERGAVLRLADAGFDVGEEVAVEGEVGGHGRKF